jgi:hypothetical protein
LRPTSRVEPGTKAAVTVYGRNLGTSAKPSEWRINDLPLDALPVTVTPADDILKRGLFRFTEHPTGHSVLPTAATCTAATRFSARANRRTNSLT